MRKQHQRHQRHDSAAASNPVAQSYWHLVATGGGTAFLGFAAGIALAPAHHRFWVISLALMIVGAAVLTCGMLMRHGRSIEEAYRFGHDLGFEAGYRAGARDESRFHSGNVA